MSTVTESWKLRHSDRSSMSMEWDPTRYFNTTTPPPPFALLVLNQPINGSAFSVLRKHAKFTVCADGGANRYFDLMRRHGQESTNLPDAIVGDLDSIRPEVRRHYAELGVIIIEDEDQYSTDFGKCLRFLKARLAEISGGPECAGLDDPDLQNTSMDVLVIGGLGGRVDQAFSQIHHLYAASDCASDAISDTTSDTTSSITSATRQGSQEESAPGNLYLISEESITFILRRGRNVIHTPGQWMSSVQSRCSPETGSSRPEFLEENVGIVPMTGPTRISTQGFQWDVKNWSTAIGGNLSTSNHIRAERVVVECEEAVLFTVELADRLKVGRSSW